MHLDRRPGGHRTPRIPFAGLLACVVMAASCTTARSQTPAATPPWTDPDEACQRQRERLRAEVCDPGDPETPCDVDDLACEQSLDLDGDGRADRVQLVLAGDEVTLGVHWGHGGTELIDDVQVFDEGRLMETIGSFSWLAHWVVARRAGDGYDIQVLMNIVHFEVLDARGDGLYCSGLDAASVLYYTTQGWRILHLGF